MFAIPLLAVLLAADPVPVAGRPVDFSGAVGGPFEVTTHTYHVSEVPFDPYIVEEGCPIHLVVRVVGAGDFSHMRRPNLQKNPEFTQRFTIEDEPERDLPNRAGREIEYILRPRSIDVKEVPKIKFVYFNPAIRPTDRGFQTSYTSVIPLSVFPSKPPKTYVPDNVNAWVKNNSLNYNDTLEACGRDLPWIQLIVSEIERWLPTSVESGRRWIIAILFWTPPIVCSIWYLLARPAKCRSIDRARICCLERLSGQLNDPSRQIAEAVRSVAEHQLGFCIRNVTTEELASILERQNTNETTVMRLLKILQHCEQDRFGRARLDDNRVIEARELIREWEK
jgi:hypothetical protein